MNCLFNPARRARKMTVGTAIVLMQIGKEPSTFGCAEIVADRLSRATAGGPACALKSFNSLTGHPQFELTEYGQQVKDELSTLICLSTRQ
jgi:hypothetical protein